MQRYRFGPLERRGLIGSLAPAAGDRDRGEPHRRRGPDAHALGREPASSRARARLAARWCSASGRSAAARPRSGCRSSAATRRAAPAAARFRLASASSRSAVRRRMADPSRSPRFQTGCRRSRTARRSAPRRTGRRDEGPRARTYTAALAVRVTSFGLLDRAEQEAARPAGAAYSPVSRGRALRSAGSSGSSAPCRPTATRSVATSARRGTRDSVAGRLAADAVLPRADEHRARRSRRITSSSSACRSMRSAPGGRSSAPAASKAPMPARAECCCASSRRSPSGWPLPTSRSSVRSAPACSPSRIPGGVRSLVATRARASRGRRPRPRRHRRGRGLAGRQRETSWGIYRTDGAFHATYWISGWPRIDVGAAFLSPLLLHAQMVRAIARHDRADLAAEGDPRGRSRADKRHRRP